MRKLLLAALCLAAAALTAGEPPHASAQSPFFQPCFRTELGDDTPGAASDITTTIGIGVGDDCEYQAGVDNKNMYIFDELVHFTPPEWEVARGADVPDGTQVGQIEMMATLGLLNNPCQNQLTVDMTLYDASTTSSPAIALPPAGTTNRMKPLADDANANGVPDGAERWPTYLTQLAEENSWELAKLRQRIIGIDLIEQASNLVYTWNLLVFEPGSPANIAGQVYPVDPSRGWMTMIVMNDPTMATSSTDFITDFCSPFRFEWVTSGTANGSTYRRNPTATGEFTLLASSSRDADNDGYENQLDTCPLVPNVGDARTSPDPGDDDIDGLDEACDPDPNRGPGLCGGFGCDLDGDRWQERGDNCPLIANPLQEDRDRDAIGDACDPNPDDPNAQGTQARVCIPNDPMLTGASVFAEVYSDFAAFVDPCNPGPFPCACDPITPTPSPTPRQPGELPKTGASTSSANPTAVAALAGVSAFVAILGAWAAVRARRRL